MTRDRLHLLYQHCADLALDVEWAPLGEHRRGFYRHPRLIVINDRLTRAQATATLAHELGHERFGDTCSTPAAERRAWEYGAALIVTPEEYADAEALVGHHPAALALHLEVTPRLIEAWRRWWWTRGRLVSPRSDVSHS
ncbi:ImmA/IrrE family metallo-endopeptidase [Nocardioides aequoreus]|uniref:ImmA/IrrE family metallo-endopeptidase n=1 Tax=Nocardioides aequoreus TaxID=397278 RepID=UPI0006924CCA|nr:ImmA/IrrE family metallo-endopeptidase [Nocardioides aequoreus]